LSWGVISKGLLVGSCFGPVMLRIPRAPRASILWLYAAGILLTMFILGVYWRANKKAVVR
jgi:hypothetical protein